MIKKSLLVTLFFFQSFLLAAQSDKAMLKELFSASSTKDIIPTALWKISGNDVSRNVYLLGSCHVVGLDWLKRQPGMEEVIKNSSTLVTESFGATVSSSELSAYKSLKAVDLLDKEQYRVLDSFFRANAGETEGLANEDAKNASVVDMAGGILEMLLRQNVKGTYTQMDLELFQLFKSQKKKTGALETPQDLDFQVKDSVAAKILLDKYTDLVKSRNIFNLDDENSEVNTLIQWYKSQKFDYRLNKDWPPNLIQERSAMTVPERNKKWMEVLKNNFKTENTLIVVGIFHFFYKTGLIALLREEGYIVEPVVFN
ncbi:MAG: TraB/GumN family protein [Bacteroidota bacterium]